VTPDGLLPALVAESAKKSRVCWLSWGGSAPRLAWHAWYDDALLVLSKNGEQLLDGLADAGTVTVTMRSKDTGGRLVEWTGTVEVTDPGAESWEPTAAALLAVRLNLPDPPGTLEAWRTTGTVMRIAPVVATQEFGSGPLP
jgi:hypothetical protein